MKLTLLGTGMPVPNPARRGPSQVIEAGDELVLVDCGAGALYRLLEAGYHSAAAPRGPGGRGLRLPLRAIAITHLHSDHITGLPDLLWGGWVGRWWQEAPPIVGPPGTREFIADLLHAFRYDIRIRLDGDQVGRRQALVADVHEVEEGWTCAGSDWRLSAFRVDHDPVDQAFGYRLDASEGSVVISGDTRPSENLVRHAQGTDLLVHEVYWRPSMEQALAAVKDDPVQYRRQHYVASYHTSSDDVGRIAARSEAKQLVLSHLLLGQGTPSELQADVAARFPRMVTVGDDLQTFEITR